MGFDDVMLADLLSECRTRLRGIFSLLNAAAEADSVVDRGRSCCCTGRPASSLTAWSGYGALRRVD